MSRIVSYRIVFVVEQPVVYRTRALGAALLL